jgi:hypothetical protein
MSRKNTVGAPEGRRPMGRKTMHAFCQIVMATILAFSGIATGGDKTAAEDKLAGLDRFAGEWEVEGKWSDGQTLLARTVYEWGLNKKLMKASTFVKDGKKEYQRYEGILAWHPEKKSLFQISFAFDGSISEVLMHAKDKDTYQIGFEPFTAGKPTKVRQTLRFLDNDRYQWQVFIQEGTDWKQIIDATWKRKLPR